MPVLHLRRRGPVGQATAHIEPWLSDFVDPQSSQLSPLLSPSVQTPADTGLSIPGLTLRHDFYVGGAALSVGGAALSVGQFGNPQRIRLDNRLQQRRRH